ncbi:MAG: 4-hydroxy-tetrahydrodipicolinate synthase [Chitinophagales bacterium]|nr:4-hydroxy-tetrahydrodipicolinate synthase [Chitinophagales bacterium]
MSKMNFSGVGVALVTPFNEKKEINYNEFEKVCNYVIENGVDYLVVLGTTGESVVLSKKEKQDLIKATVAVAKGKVPVVAGFGGNNTYKIADELKSYELEGVDAVLSVSPSYNKPTQEGIYEHYKVIANSTDLPIILYNVPSRTASNIRATTTLQLAHEFKNIIGIKEATNDWNQITELCRNKPEGFFLISGDDKLALPEISIGFDGVISVIANATPRLFSTMIHRGMAKDFEGARSILFELDELITMLFEQGNPAGVKCALEHLGICKDELRLPLMPVNYDLRRRMGVKIANLTREFERLIGEKLSA